MLQFKYLLIITEEGTKYLPNIYFEMFEKGIITESDYNNQL